MSIEKTTIRPTNGNLFNPFVVLLFELSYNATPLILTILKMLGIFSAV